MTFLPARLLSALLLPAVLPALLLQALCVPRAAGAEEPGGLAHPDLWPQLGTPAPDAHDERLIRALMQRMSLREKVGQVVQADLGTIRPDDLRRYPLGAILAGGDALPLGGDVRSDPALWLETARAFNTVAQQRRHGHEPLPLLFGIDAVHGNAHVRGATVFPHNVGLGAIHDAALIQRIAEATAQETTVLGINWVFAPTVAVPQDLRWGRSYEGYARDPAEVRAYAAAAVRGLQAGGVAATAKHFIGDGGTLHGIDQGDDEASEAELIATHAQGYLGAIDAGVLTVMASYSSWQGRKMHGNESLLTRVLKRRLGFQGFVVGDWNGHGQVPGCSDRSCPKAFNAGIDMLMAPATWRELFDDLLAQLQQGVIATARLDDAVRRILRVKARLGLLAGAHASVGARAPQGAFDRIGAASHRALAREAVRRSLVLLKNNEHVLPIAASAHVLVAGVAADDIGRQCGGWTLTWQGGEHHNADFPQGQSIYAALAAAIAAGGGSVELSADAHYDRVPDVALVIYGEHPYAEMRGDRPNLEFDGHEAGQLELLQRLHAAHVPVVSVFLSGRPLWVNPELNASDAFVAAWLPGTEGGGVADVLIGDASGAPRYDFDGRLSFAWPSAAASDAMPLFDAGYGLRYGDTRLLPPLPESSSTQGM